MNNKIADYSTPNVSAVDGIWHVSLFGSGIVQGANQDQRIGNKIMIRNVSGKITIDGTSGLTSSTLARIMVFRMQRNYLNDSPVNSPLPTNIQKWPNYKDGFQVLLDQEFILAPSGLEGDLKSFSFVRKVNQPLVYLQDGSTASEKGTLFIAITTDKATTGPNTGGFIQVTYTDMAA